MQNRSYLLNLALRLDEIWLLWHLLPPNQPSTLSWQSGMRPFTAYEQSDQALEVFQGQFLWSEPHHAPTGQRRLEVFLKVGSESCRAVVATIDVIAGPRCSATDGLN
jgi:hypothetical protein